MDRPKDGWTFEAILKVMDERDRLYHTRFDCAQVAIEKAEQVAKDKSGHFYSLVGLLIAMASLLVALGTAIVGGILILKH